MKIIYSLIISLFASSAFAQQPSYQAILEKEIVSNEITNTVDALKKPYVVMVSIDGFRYDYAKKYNAKNILALAENGASTTRLIPSFPSKTFPNHYTLATGLYPENHGIVSNSFYDKNKSEEYKIGDPKSVTNGDWYGGVPIWNLAQLQGVCAASYFWVGSEANINGLYPKYYYGYEKNTPYEYLIRRVLEWLQLPEKVRPHLLTLYFSLVDTQGHTFGPDAKETEEAVLYVDKQIGALREGIGQSGLPIYLLVTSDHGMDNVSKNINIHEYVTLEKEQFYSGPVAMIYTKNEQEKEDLFEKLNSKPLFRVYKRENVPNYLNFSKNDRIGDLVLITDAPNNIIYSEKENVDIKRPGGTHGYDPFENPNMGAIFYIEGPTIKKNYQLAPFENIHVYPLIAHLLDLKIIAPIDGKLEATSSIFEQTK